IISHLGKSLEESGSEQALGKHPFSNLGINLIKADNPFTLMDSLVNRSIASIQEISSIISKRSIPDEHAKSLENIKNLIQDSVVLFPLAESGNLRLVDTTNP